MAARYWVGGFAAVWDNTAGTKWATSSGGAGGASVPTSVDDVFVDGLYNGSTGIQISNSGAVTCKSLDFTGYSATAYFSGAGINFYGNLTIPASTTVNILFGTPAFGWNAAATLTTAQSLSGFNISINAGTLTLASNLTCSNIEMSSSAATFNSAGFTLNCVQIQRFYSGSSGSFIFTGSIINISGSTNCFYVEFAFGSVTGGTINFSSATPSLATPGLNMGTTTFNFTGITTLSWNIGGGITVAVLSIIGNANKFCAVNFQNVSGPLTISGLLTITGNSAINRIIVRSPTMGTAMSSSAGSFSLTNVDFRDINNTGTTWTGTSLGDCLGNTGITLTTPSTQTFQGGVGVDKSWSDITAWTSRVPLPQDTAQFTGGSVGVVRADMPRLCKSISAGSAAGLFFEWEVTSVIDPSGVTGSEVYGGMDVSPASVSFHTVVSNYNLRFLGRSGTNQIYTNLHDISGGGTDFKIVFESGSGATGVVYSLVDNLSIPNSKVEIKSGGLDMAGNYISSAFVETLSTALAYLTFGSGGEVKIRVRSSGSFGPTFTAGASSNISAANGIVSFLDTGASTRSFNGGGKTYGTINYTVSGSLGQLNIAGNNTITTVNFSNASGVRTVGFADSSTNTITNFNFNGIVGSQAILHSAADFLSHTLNITNANVSYLTISRSIATPPHYAGLGSVNGGNNTGWVFGNSGFFNMI